MIRRPPRSTQSRSSAASDVYKRQVVEIFELNAGSGLRVCWVLRIDLLEVPVAPVVIQEDGIDQVMRIAPSVDHQSHVVCPRREVRSPISTSRAEYSASNRLEVFVR